MIKYDWKGLLIMSSYVLRLLEDRLEKGGEISPALPPCKRVIYVVEGGMTGPGEARDFTPNSAWFGTGACALKAGPEGARLWRWELLEAPAADEGLAAGAGLHSRARMHNGIELDPRSEYLLRCDRVDFPLGGIAYTHIHAGPGIRCLLQGEIKVRTKGEEWLVRPYECWFERGPDPIYARASDEPTSFVRAMVVPRSYQGRTTITYVKAEDAEKPKPQQYTRFVDEFIDP